MHNWFRRISEHSYNCISLFNKWSLRNFICFFFLIISSHYWIPQNMVDVEHDGSAIEKYLGSVHRIWIRNTRWFYVDESNVDANEWECLVIAIERASRRHIYVGLHGSSAHLSASRATIAWGKGGGGRKDCCRHFFPFWMLLGFHSPRIVFIRGKEKVFHFDRAFVLIPPTVFSHSSKRFRPSLTILRVKELDRLSMPCR